MKNLVRLSAGFGFSAFITTPVWAGTAPAPVGAFSPSQYPVLSSTSAPPNVMLLLDDSTSMEDIVSGTSDTKMVIAKRVLKDVVAQNRDLRFGLFTFDPNPLGPVKVVSNKSEPSQDEVDAASQGKLIFDVKDISGPSNDNNYKSLLSEIDAIPTHGYYDIRTPLGKTFYEITRYFRGMTRWHEAGTGKYVSPIQYRCQKNFVIVVTDGDPTWDYDFPTKDDEPQGQGTVNGVFQLPDWDKIRFLNNIDTDGNWRFGDQKTKGGDTNENVYMDDYAKFAYDIDFRPAGLDSAGKSYTSQGSVKQNLITYTIGYNTGDTTQMLKRAADYGHGAYYTANNAAQLTESLTSVIGSISTQAGSGGAGASNSGKLTTNSVYYVTKFNPENWSGTVEAYKLDPVTGELVTPAVWSTDDTITSSANNSTVYQTYKTGSSPKVVSLDFSQLSAAQKNTLDAGVSAPLTGGSLIDWVSGKDVAGLRERKVLLGDIMGASIVRASATEALAVGTAGDTSYETYLAAKRDNMTTSLVVGANDGLLHVIQASNGAQRYAYLPSASLPSLPLIASPNYTTHRRLVDGPISIADAQIDGSWMTLAIADMGGGGKSLFAIRLFGEDGVSDQVRALWEASAPEVDTPSSDWNDLGFTYSQPSVARLADGTWVALFGNGYGSHHGVAALYVVNIKDGSLIRKIVVDDNTSGSATDIATGSGLSSVRQLVDGEFHLKSAYAGDLRGNLWKFDLSGAPANWTANVLFKAGAGHPITARPQLMDNPKGGQLVMVGTGKFLEMSDKTDQTQQSFYAIWDKPGGALPVDKTTLLQQTTDATSLGDYFTATNKPIDWAVNNGWYIDLPAAGERVLNDAELTRGRVVFATARLEEQRDPCEGTGKGRLVEVEALSGGMLGYPVLDTNGDGKIDDKDQVVAGTNINDGITGGITIVESDGGLDSKFLTSSSGAVHRILELGASMPYSKRIMWRQLQ